MARERVRESVRFEVFKRDSFTCQYCGEKAPDAVLEVDHITPVSKGGTSDIINLVTSCRSCNSGKSDRTLTDATVVAKARAQAEQLEERRQQLKMIAEWHMSLVDMQSTAVQQIETLWMSAARRPDGCALTDVARAEVGKWIRRHGFERVCNAAVRAANKLISSSQQDDDEARGDAFWSIPKICSVMTAEDNNPGVGKLFYIRGILRRRCNYVNERGCIAMLKQARECGVDVAWMERVAKEVTSWTQFRDAVSEAIAGMYDNEDQEATDGQNA
jgi:hypothetical protein